MAFGIDESRLRMISLTGLALAVIGFLLIVINEYLAVGIVFLIVGLILASVMKVAFTLRLRYEMTRK